MPIISGDECVKYSSISASAATVEASGKIAIVQDRINMITNNYFLTDLYVQGAVTFNATDRTIIMSGVDFSAYGLYSGCEVYVYGSYLNDQYVTTSSVSGSTITCATGTTFIDERSGASVMLSVVKWPTAIKQTAALMVEYDYDKRGKRDADVKSRSLGPWSESYADTPFGYPASLIDQLSNYTVARIG